MKFYNIGIQQSFLHVSFLLMNIINNKNSKYVETTRLPIPVNDDSDEWGPQLGREFRVKDDETRLDNIATRERSNGDTFDNISLLSPLGFSLSLPPLLRSLISEAAESSS